MKIYLILVLNLFIINAVLAADELFFTGTWSSSQYNKGELPDIDLQGNSLRQIVKVSIPGEQLRFHFSNIYGKEELELKSVHVAKSAGQGTGSIIMETDTEITFNGQYNVSIPAYADIVSDIIPFSLSALDEVAITIQYGKIPFDFTGHTSSRTYSFVELGNTVSKETFSSAHKFLHWFTIAAIDVVDNEKKTEAILCYGDSITDGRGSTNDKQNRWPDVLSERLQSHPATRHLAILNQAIGGSSLYGQNNPVWPTGLGRYQKDVAEQVNVKYMIVLYGVNDILYSQRAAPVLIEGLQELIKRNRERGIITYGSPILPFKTNDDWTEEKNKIKETVNQWILNTPANEGGFDAIIDFASVVADPNDAMVLKAELSDGDGLHPNYLGYAAMGNSIDLELFINNENENENENENYDENESEYEYEDEDEVINSDEENNENNEFDDSEVTVVNETEDSINDE